MFAIKITVIYFSAAWSSVKIVAVEGERGRHGRDSNPLAPFCCALGKNTLRQLALVDGFCKQL